MGLVKADSWPDEGAWAMDDLAAPIHRWLTSRTSGMTSVSVPPNVELTTVQGLSRLDELAVACKPGHVCNAVAQMGSVKQQLREARAIMPGRVMSAASALCCKAVNEGWVDSPVDMVLALSALHRTIGGRGTGLAIALKDLANAVWTRPSDGSTSALPARLVNLAPLFNRAFDEALQACNTSERDRASVGVARRKALAGWPTMDPLAALAA